MNAKEVNQQLNHLQVEMVTSRHLHDGTKALYNAACWTGNGKAAQGHRETLHALLDAELDHQASIMQLTRKLLESGGV